MAAKKKRRKNSHRHSPATPVTPVIPKETLYQKIRRVARGWFNLDTKKRWKYRPSVFTLAIGLLQWLWILILIGGIMARNHDVLGQRIHVEFLVVLLAVILYLAGVVLNAYYLGLRWAQRTVLAMLAGSCITWILFVAIEERLPGLVAWPLTMIWPAALLYLLRRPVFLAPPASQ